MERHGPEISDVIVDYDPTTLVRRVVSRTAALARLVDVPPRAKRIARRVGERGDALDPDAVDGVLVRSHLELQRLHEEFRIGDAMRAALAPMLALARTRCAGRRPRVVDLGCGLGYVLRWLAVRGELGDVELIGVDYNQTFIAAATRLATREHVPCRFVAANAFRLDEPADIFISTGVLHHFRGAELASVFAEHERSPAIGFVHLDIRPSWIASFGSWMFHRARMREPLAQFDGYWSAVRAHPAHAMCAAARTGAPSFALGTLDARLGVRSLVRILYATVGLRGTAVELADGYRAFGRRFEAAA